MEKYAIPSASLGVKPYNKSKENVKKNLIFHEASWGSLATDTRVWNWDPFYWIPWLYRSITLYLCWFPSWNTTVSHLLIAKMDTKLMFMNFLSLTGYGNLYLFSPILFSFLLYLGFYTSVGRIKVFRDIKDNIFMQNSGRKNPMKVRHFYIL